MSYPFRGAVALLAGLFAVAGTAQAQSDPPSRVGRLAFTEGSVSFHDQDEAGWSKAVVNTPLTSGDAIWTEPNAESEVSLAGTRIRLDGGTELEMLAIDDSQTRLQLAQGRLDIKTFTLDGKTPYQIVTPRGTISLQQQGDYYIQAGSTEDATRLGVRSGAAQIQSLNGQTLAVRAGEVGEIDGDVGTPQLRTVNSAPPPLQPYWAARDRQVSYDAPTQYLSSDVTGYEDLNTYGSWSNDKQYGNVWTPRSVPADWQPYRTGHWSNVQPWGWTWIDDQPWGYAPYHYGRWANSSNRWVWIPPQRSVQPVYAPALVAFIGGVELALSLGNQGTAPVGWFPLGPRETYVPSYTADRDYYNRINRSAEIQQNTLDDRWQRAQRREPAANPAASAMVNQRFVTVVPSETFVRSQPVARAALKVAPEKIATAPVAIVAAPPAPTASLAVKPSGATAPLATPASKPPEAKAAPAPATAPAPVAPPTAAPPTAAAPIANPPEPKAATAPPAAAPAARPAEMKPNEAKVDAQPKVVVSPNLPVALPVAKTAITDMPALGKPVATERPTPAPGPKITVITPPTSAVPNAPRPMREAPVLAPRHGPAPPVLKDDKATAAPSKPAQPEAKAVEQPKPTTTPPPRETPPAQRQAAPVEPPKVDAAPKPAEEKK
jgi:hypothetical protein